jgi:hypothetical protein
LKGILDLDIIKKGLENKELKFDTIDPKTARKIETKLNFIRNSSLRLKERT